MTKDSRNRYEKLRQALKTGANLPPVDLDFMAEYEQKAELAQKRASSVSVPLRAEKLLLGGLTRRGWEQ